jgi:protein-tyrosine phosphatase
MLTMSSYCTTIIHVFCPYIIAFSGWWIGGRYSHLLRKQWGGIVDLTVEFPEFCKTQNYLCIPIWDGVPPTPDQLEQAAVFAVNSKKDGDVLFHCAHGRGRSTTTMCAALVKSGMFTSWQEAFNAIKPGRPVIKLNTKMKNALAQWQQKYAKKL